MSRSGRPLSPYFQQTVASRLFTAQKLLRFASTAFDVWLPAALQGNE